MSAEEGQGKVQEAERREAEAALKVMRRWAGQRRSRRGRGSQEREVRQGAGGRAGSAPELHVCAPPRVPSTDLDPTLHPGTEAPMPL